MGKLTDVAIRAWIRFGERFEGRSDRDGLVLTWRKKRTATCWRLRYRVAGKTRVMEIGSYADLTLAAARQAAKELRAKIALGHDVADEKQEHKSTALARIETTRSVTTVGQLADVYFERMLNGRWKHPNIVRSRIEEDIRPHGLGLPISHFSVDLLLVDAENDRKVTSRACHAVHGARLTARSSR